MSVACVLTESVYPVRAVSRHQDTTIYVGGAPAGMTELPTLDGCVRGLVVAGKILRLRQASANRHGKRNCFTTLICSKISLMGFTSQTK